MGRPVRNIAGTRVKVCLAQINTTPGDFEGNLQRIRTGVDAATAGGAHLVVFPELTIPGYLTQDLIYHPAYVARNLAVLDEVKAMTIDTPCAVVVGFIDHNPGPGKPFRNCAAVFRGGDEVARYSKHLLPFYDVFDELRYFEPGTELAVIDVAGERVGIVICEDLWNDKGSDGYDYAANPMQRYRDQGVDCVVSLNSSPYSTDKPVDRIRRIAPTSVGGPDVVYCNQRGGQDELVFDGGSFVLRGGDLLHLSGTVDEDSFDIVDLTQEPAVQDVAAKSTEIRKRSCSLLDLLVLGLKDYVVKSGFRELVLASSGGVDSAVVAALASRAVGPDHVHAVRLPSIYSSDHSRSDAIALHRNLGCYDYAIGVDHQPLVSMLNTHFHAHPGDAQNLVTQVFAEDRYGGVADENIQARIRDLYVMHFSNAFGAMPLSTGNKTESACGYYTHFDMNFSFAPLKDLYKRQVVDIARQIPEIPDNIWLKPPSAELAEGQTDEASLLPYSVLDPIVESYVEHYISSFNVFVEWTAGRRDEISQDPDRLARWLGEPSSATEYQRIISLIGRMEYKRRQTCPGTKVSKVAFGIGRRIPIVEKWL